MIKTIQYIAAAILFVMLFEGLFTLGAAFKLENYGLITCLGQLFIVTFAVTTAVRMSYEE
jgi:hypothetical protein